MNSIGEHSSIAEELFFEIPELEHKLHAVQKSVRGGYFTIPEALLNYKVKEIDYVLYLLLINKEKLKHLNKQSQVFNAMKAIVEIFEDSSKNFNEKGQIDFDGIKKIAENFNTSKRVLVH